MTGLSGYRGLHEKTWLLYWSSNCFSVCCIKFQWANTDEKWTKMTFPALFTSFQCRCLYSSMPPRQHFVFSKLSLHCLMTKNLPRIEWRIFGTLTWQMEKLWYNHPYLTWFCSCFWSWFRRYPVVRFVSAAIFCETRLHAWTLVSNPRFQVPAF